MVFWLDDIFCTHRRKAQPIFKHSLNIPIMLVAMLDEWTNLGEWSIQLAEASKSLLWLYSSKPRYRSPGLRGIGRYGKVSPYKSCESRGVLPVAKAYLSGLHFSLGMQAHRNIWIGHRKSRLVSRPDSWYPDS